MRNLIAIRHSGDAQRRELFQVDFCVSEDKHHSARTLCEGPQYSAFANKSILLGPHSDRH